MEIVKKGKKKKYKIVCETCDTTLKYSKKDIFTIKEKVKGGIQKTIKPNKKYIKYVLHKYNCVKCPVCHNIIKIDLDVESLLKNKQKYWKRVK